MLGYAHGGRYVVTLFDINKLAVNIAAIFGRTRKEIRIHANAQPAPCVVEADKGQIEQVLLNIFINAWQAMPDGGDLYLETSIVSIDKTAGRSYQIQPGSYVKVSITDTGTGMDETVLRRIFDPYFTTKAFGHGAGLSLASAYGIVKSHGGVITVFSEIGQGTSFNIHLPVSERNPDKEVFVQEKLVKGTETILLVDDEKMIIDVGKAMLEKLGYQVIVAESGKRAVDAAQQKLDEIDLVLLDLTMPGMDGGTAFDRIREIRPAMPVILFSGYAILDKAAEIMQRGCNGFIQKPFDISKLSKIIRNILDEAKASNQEPLS